MRFASLALVTALAASSTFAVACGTSTIGPSSGDAGGTLLDADTDAGSTDPPEASAEVDAAPCMPAKITKSGEIPCGDRTCESGVQRCCISGTSAVCVGISAACPTPTAATLSCDALFACNGSGEVCCASVAAANDAARCPPLVVTFKADSDVSCAASCGSGAELCSDDGSGASGCKSGRTCTPALFRTSVGDALVGVCR
jgi:hypothetical protein